MRRTCMVAVGALALVVAGCGDDKKTSASKPTKAAYIAKADAICIDGKTKAKRYADQLSALPATAQVTDTVAPIQGGLGVARSTIEKVRGLARPAEDAATLDAYFDALDKELTAGEKLLAAAKTNDITKVQQAGAGNPQLKADRRQIAQKYGFEHCS